jgi:hypothetical protein
MGGPTTIGLHTVTLLALASESAKRGILGERTRSAYARLREKVAAWANSDAAALEEVHIPDLLRSRIIDTIEVRPKDDRLAIRNMASALAQSLRDDVRRGSLGFSLRRLEEIDGQLKTFT